MSQTFPKDCRLLTSADFGVVFKKPLKLTGDSFDLYARANTLSRARLGLAVSKKALKKSVDRNRVKRMLREYFRHQAERLTGFDIVVVVKKNIGACPKIKQAELIVRHFQKLLERLDSLS